MKKNVKNWIATAALASATLLGNADAKADDSVPETKEEKTKIVELGRSLAEQDKNAYYEKKARELLKVPAEVRSLLNADIRCQLAEIGDLIVKDTDHPFDVVTRMNEREYLKNANNTVVDYLNQELDGDSEGRGRLDLSQCKTIELVESSYDSYLILKGKKGRVALSIIEQMDDYSYMIVKVRTNQNPEFPSPYTDPSFRCITIDTENKTCQISGDHSASPVMSYAQTEKVKTLTPAAKQAVKNKVHD